jgi:Xaa-Pro dipeptidase
MPQVDVSDSTYRVRIAKVQDAMKEFGLKAIVLEPGPAMQYLTGVRWGRSERTFVVVLPVRGEPAYILPGFEEMRARELIHVGNDIRIWQEDESPYAKIAEALKDRGAASGRVGIDETGRFFVFDGIRKNTSQVEFVGAGPVLKSAGVDMSQRSDSGRGGRGKL